MRTFLECPHPDDMIHESDHLSELISLLVNTVTRDISNRINWDQDRVGITRAELS